MVGAEARAGTTVPAPWKRSTSSRTSPTGVPPLALTGERTLPDVPEENYWFRRHLAVYEWIAARVARPAGRRSRLRRGLRLGRARRDARPRWSASTPTPRRTSTRGCATGAPNLRFERDLVESYAGPCDAIVFLQTIEHIDDPGALLEGFAARRRGAATSRPRTGSRSPPRARRSPTTPGICASTRPPSTARCSSRALLEVELYGVFHARKLRLHELAIARRLGPRPPGAADHEALLRPLRARDRRLRLRDQAGRRLRPRPRPRLPRRLPAMTRRRPGRGPGARPSQPHALRRGLRHLSVRRGVAVRRRDPLLRAGLRASPSGVTITVTPVLADQLEARGVAERLLEFLRAFRIGSVRGRRATTSSRPTATPAGPRPTATAPRSRGSRRSTATCCELFADPADEGRVELLASAATHAVLPLVATRAGRAAADRRRAALAPAALRRAARVLAARVRVRARARAAARRARPALLLHRPERARASRSRRWRRSRPRARRSAFAIDWEAVRWLWSLDGYPSDPLHADFHRKSLRGARPWSIGGEPYDPDAAAERAREQGREFVAAVAARLERFAAERGARRADRVRDRHRAARATGGGRARPGSRRCLRPRPRARGRAGHARRGARAPSGRGARAAPLELGRGQGPAHLGLARGRRPRHGRPPARAAAAARRSARGLEPRSPSAPRASCSRCRRATGPSSTSAVRPATTRGSGPRTTRARCSRRSIRRLRRPTRGCGTWLPTSASARCSSPSAITE